MTAAPLTVSVSKMTASPALRSDSCASPFLSTSLDEVTLYVLVPAFVLIVTDDAPTAVTVPEESSPPPWPWKSGRTVDEFDVGAVDVEAVPEVVALAPTTPQAMATPATTPATTPPSAAKPARPRGRRVGG